MNRQLVVTPFVAIALVFAMATSLLAIQPSSAANSGVYITLGDSIAAGIGSSLPRERGNVAIVHTWLARLTGESGPIMNLAIPGETADSFLNGEQLRRFTETVAQFSNADIPIAAVTVSLGGNEILSLERSNSDDRQSGLNAFGLSYREAIGTIRSTVGSDVPLILTNIYDLTEGDPSLQSTDSWWIAQFNQVIADVANEQDAQVADISSRFKGRIGELTHYPYDVHPNNGGHRLIAQTIWQSLQFDREPPTITSPKSLVAASLTPTITFTVADNVAVSDVRVMSDDLVFKGPFEIEVGRYAILLDLHDVTDSDLALMIEISDDSGNVVRAVIMVEIA